MSYQVSREGRQLGVFSLEDIRAKLSTGELLANDLGWTAGMNEWRALGEIAPASAPPPESQAPRPDQPAPLAAPTVGREESVETRLQTSRASSASAKHRGRSRRRPKPDNHLVIAILVTLFCCLPLGIPAIVYASQVDGKYNAGDHLGAREAAHHAKNWIKISVVVGLLGALVYVALAFLGVTMGG
jgi:hypothetical protein